MVHVAPGPAIRRQRRSRIEMGTGVHFLMSTDTKWRTSLVAGETACLLIGKRRWIGARRVADDRLRRSPAMGAPRAFHSSGQTGQPSLPIVADIGGPDGGGSQNRGTRATDPSPPASGSPAPCEGRLTYGRRLGAAFGRCVVAAHHLD